MLPPWPSSIVAQPLSASCSVARVRISEDFDSGWQESDSWEKQADVAPTTRTIKSLDFSKDADMQTYRMRTLWSDGEKVEEWIVMGNHVAERAGGLGL